MNWKVFGSLVICISFLVVGCGDHEKYEGSWAERMYDDTYSPQECQDGSCYLYGSEPYEDDVNTDYMSCDNDSDCGPDQICSVYNECTDLVMECPGTEECLAGSAGSSDVWEDDVTFVGTFTGDELSGRISATVAIYETHVTGSGAIQLDNGASRIWVDITGMRDGNGLRGHLVEPEYYTEYDDVQNGESFRALYSAEIVSGSEIIGNVIVSAEEEYFAEFVLYRNSPCGCEIEPDCTSNGDCEPGFMCRNEECVEVVARQCTANRDCENTQVCIDGVCIDVD